MSDVVIRAARASDQAYVASTWTQNMRRVRTFGGPPKSAKKTAQIVDSVLDRKDVRVLVAVKRDDDNAIVGWLAYAPTCTLLVLLYAFVRLEERRLGHARALVTSAQYRHQILGVDKPPTTVYTFEGPLTKQLKRGPLKGVGHLAPTKFMEMRQ